jgi:hypothetical protein
MGKAALRGKQATDAPRDSAGVETTAWTEGIHANHGKPSAAAPAGATGSPRGSGQVTDGGGEARSSDEAG